MGTRRETPTHVIVGLVRPIPCTRCDGSGVLDRLRQIEMQAQIVTHAWGRLGDCEDEFYPEYPGACAEQHQALDEAILALMKIANAELWERRQQAARDAVEEILANTCQMPTCGDRKINHVDGTGVCEVDDCQCGRFWVASPPSPTTGGGGEGE